MNRASRALRLAFAFLTVVPVRLREDETTDADLADSRYAYPVVGLAIGLALAILSEVLSALSAPPLLAAFLLVAGGIAACGGLHVDGLADTFDGLFLWGDPERRLTVMRDPQVGSFGVAAVVLVLLGKFAALGGLAGHHRSLALVAAATVGRTLILVSAGLARYARTAGTGRILVDATTRRDALAASAVVLGVGMILGHFAGFAASALSLGLAWSLTRLADRRLGGITGDILGALVELGELVVLVVLGLAQPLLAI